MFKKLLCRVFGHVGPVGVVYKTTNAIRRFGGNASLARQEWICPRCEQQAWAMCLIPIRAGKKKREGQQARFSGPRLSDD